LLGEIVGPLAVFLAVNALLADVDQETPGLQRALAGQKAAFSPSTAPKTLKTRLANPTRVRCGIIGSVKSEQESDDELVGRIRAGDCVAFSQLVERYQLRIQQLALTFVRNEQDAQEVVQDAFLRVHLGLGTFRGTSSFYTWLYRIVVNLAIDARRRPIRLQTGWESIAECADDSRSLELPRISNSDPHEAMSRMELDQKLTAALTRLAPYHRAVIVMREVEGMSYQEMAESLQISKGTVMSRLFHARRRLQRTLVDEMFEQ
jgi:RNA polymerase sigma-70 factor (ECF subfamily)